MPTLQSTPTEPMRKPSFDEKRVINTKLEEVYLDERVGYVAGWSDQRVAEDLGVPRKWVETQRDMNFGPVPDSGELREAIELALKTREEVQKTLAEAKGEALRLRNIADGIGRKVAPLEEALAKIDTRLAALEKAVR